MSFFDLSGEGFFEGLLKDITMIGAIEASRDSHGKSDPYKAAGLYYGYSGDLSFTDSLQLGAFLGIDGAFTDEPEVCDTETETNDYNKQQYVQSKLDINVNYINEEQKNVLLNIKKKFTQIVTDYPQSLLLPYTSKMHEFAKLIRLENIEKTTLTEFVRICNEALTLLDLFSDVCNRHDAIIDAINELSDICICLNDDYTDEKMLEFAPKMQELLDTITEKRKDDLKEVGNQKVIEEIQSLINNVHTLLHPRTDKDVADNYLKELNDIVNIVIDSITESKARRIQHLITMINNEYKNTTIPVELEGYLQDAQAIINTYRKQKINEYMSELREILCVVNNMETVEDYIKPKIQQLIYLLKAEYIEEQMPVDIESMIDLAQSIVDG